MAVNLDRLLTALAVDVQGFAICEVSRGWRLAFGRDAAPTLHYTLSGAGVMRVGPDRSFSLEQDCFVLLPRLVPHSFEGKDATRELHIQTGMTDLAQGLQTIRAGSGAAALVMACGTIRASYGGSSDFLDGLSEPLLASFADTTVLRASFRMLLDEIAVPGVGTRALTESLLKQSLVLLLRRQSLAKGPALSWLAAIRNPHLAAALSAMIERPGDAFSVDDLAAISAMSRSAFVKHFHAAFLKSPMAFLKELRLRLAARLLRTTDLPVKVIATRVGYSSRSYFSRSFAGSYGVDPTRFRVSGRAGPGALPSPGNSDGAGFGQRS